MYTGSKYNINVFVTCVGLDNIWDTLKKDWVGFKKKHSKSSLTIIRLLIVVKVYKTFTFNIEKPKRRCSKCSHNGIHI